MNVDIQEPFKHDNIEPIERTCIDCHKGIAHELPEGVDEHQASAPSDAIHANVVTDWTDP